MRQEKVHVADQRCLRVEKSIPITRKDGPLLHELQSGKKLLLKVGEDMESQENSHTISKSRSVVNVRTAKDGCPLRKNEVSSAARRWLRWGIVQRSMRLPGSPLTTESGFQGPTSKSQFQGRALGGWFFSQFT